MFERILVAYVRWYLGHKPLARAISAAVAVGVFVFWWALFGLKAAVIVEAVVVGLTVAQWVMSRRRVARR